MLKEANVLCRRLWKDESGVALAITVVVFLTLFMMVASVYAVGEIVRQRVEIQNAADAAAYSGAIVQADTISRIAAINRAMAWTYAQHVRMEMDAIVDRWLEIVIMKWFPDYFRARMQAMMSTCILGPFTGMDDWYCGQGYLQREHVRINQRIWVSIYEIIAERAAAAGAGKNWMMLLAPITEQHVIINLMNQHEDDLLARMPDGIYKTVRDVVRMNVKDTENDEMAGGADFMFNLKQASNAKNNFVILTNSYEDEELFLNYADLRAPPQEFDRGAGEGEWFVRDPDGQPGGIQRKYKQRSNMLVADWDYFGRQWELVELPPFCVPGTPVQGHTEVKGQEGYNSVFYMTEKCKPWKFRPEFFARGGSIVAGVSRRVNNPWFFVYGSPAEEGIFKPFTIDDRGRFMWASAAAIAAHSPNSPGPSQGMFDPTYWSPARKMYNLKYSDWDAVLLPLHRAWARGIDRQWQGDTAGEILNALKGGWEKVYGGGGALGVQGGPELMNPGAEVNYGGAEKMVLH